jgi:AcrR family transcriptional regulator
MEAMATEPAESRLSERLLRLMDEAEALFAREGFLHLSTADLAARLRCSKRALYTIAPCAEKFFEAVLTRRLKGFEKTLICRIESAPDTTSALLAYIDSLVLILEGDSPVFLRDMQQFPAGLRLKREFQLRVADALARVIERGEREHVFRKIDPRVAAEALLVAVGRMIEPDFLSRSPITAAEAVRQLYQIFAFGLYNTRPDDRRSSTIVNARRKLKGSSSSTLT